MPVSGGLFTGLAFSFADTLAEIDSIDSLAKDFIDRDSLYALKNMHDSLSIFRKQRINRPYKWEIPLDKPLQTVISEGRFESGDRKGINVFGTLSSVWVIEQMSNQQGIQFCVNANALASTKIAIWQLPDNGDPIEIARWRFEMGSRDSPGCHFHTQVLGDEGDTMFPHALSVPRLPSIMITMTDSLDFLLGELFQDEWRKKLQSGNGARTDVFWGRQKERMERLLCWKLEMINKSSGSAWASLKTAKPVNENLFV